MYCVLSHPKTNKSSVVIKRGTDCVEPDQVETINALLAVATFTDAENLTLPTIPGVQPLKSVTAVLHHKTPKPDLKWTVEVDGTYYMGEHKPFATASINAATGNACLMGATEVSIPITNPLRAYFKAREFRLRAIEATLKPKGTKVYTWWKSLGYPTNRFEKVVNGGDNHPEMRAAIMELTGLPEEKLWPNIVWGI